MKAKKIKFSSYISSKLFLVLGTLFKLLEVVFELFIPIFMGYLIDDGIGKANYDIIYQMLGLIILFALLGYVTTIFSHYIISNVSQKFSSNLRTAIFNKVLFFSNENTADLQASSLLNRLNNDTSTLTNTLALSMRIASRAPFLMIGSLIALFIKAPSVGFVLLIVIPILIISVVGIILLMMRAHRLEQMENDKASNLIKQNIEGIRPIKAFNKEDKEQNKFIRQNNVVSFLKRKLGWLSSLGSPFINLVLNVVLVIMLLLINRSYVPANYNNGDVLAVINYTTQLTLAMISFLNLILLYSRAISSTKRIKAVLAVEEKTGGTLILDSNVKSINMKNVDFSFNHQSKLLQNINFEIKKGQTLGIVGLTGSGKSTLVNLLGRFSDVNNGSIFINDVNIKDYSINSLRANISYVFQNNYLLESTLYENIATGREYSKKEVLNALSLAGYDVDESFLDTKVEKGGSNFSGGQKQRINIARALINKSPILILDDCLSSLDNLTSKRVRNNIAKLEHQPLVIIVSQQLHVLENADQIIVLEEGLITARGTHKQLLESSHIYKDIYMSQNQEVEGI